MVFRLWGAPHPVLPGWLLHIPAGTCSGKGLLLARSRQYPTPSYPALVFRYESALCDRKCLAILGETSPGQPSRAEAHNGHFSTVTMHSGRATKLSLRGTPTGRGLKGRAIGRLAKRRSRETHPAGMLAPRSFRCKSLARLILQPNLLGVSMA